VALSPQTANQERLGRPLWQAAAQVMQVRFSVAATLWGAMACHKLW